MRPISAFSNVSSQSAINDSHPSRISGGGNSIEFISLTIDHVFLRVASIYESSHHICLTFPVFEIFQHFSDNCLTGVTVELRGGFIGSF